MRESNIDFCPECNEDVSFFTGDEVMHGSIKRELFEYTGKAARCSVCGTLLDVFNDENLESAYNTYRKIHGLISVDKIKEIPIKYKIGTHAISLLLGWGEMTFSRYCNGSLPSKQYSDVLQSLYDNPKYYLEKLEENKTVLFEQNYIKSKNAAISLLLPYNSESLSKIFKVASYLIGKGEDITHLALQKLLYYSQGFYYAFNDKPLFNVPCEAWTHGPVYDDVYKKYQSFGKGIIDEYADLPSFDLTCEETNLLDKVIEYLGCFTGKALENFTHKEFPWKEIDEKGLVDVKGENEISLDSIKNYFKYVINDYEILSPNEICKYSQAISMS